MSEPKAALPTDFVLLVNAREDKGYDLLLDLAVAKPQIKFVAIASQTKSDHAVDLARRRGVTNVTVLERTDKIEELYRAAKVVIVPSYRFVETFSRVCIEAQRFGKPVIGSDVGNVPNLLIHSGIVLPNKLDEWVAELSRLFQDSEYYAMRQASALENSSRYSHTGQHKAIAEVVRAAEGSFLLGIGSGIGNMTHVSPLVRRLSESLGRKIDLVVAEDHAESLFLLHNSKWVNSVFSLRNSVLSRRYDTVFVTHCFGSTRIPFRARRVIWARDWDDFHAEHTLHEARFNLESAKQLLGIDYTEEDVRNYYVGEIEYAWPNGNLVGFHGGSKGGLWTSKRWPHYTEFAARLIAAGYRVASFGMEQEYVEGTENMTGGTIEEMVRKMRACSYFIGNDSGVMHLSNSLGIPTIALFAPTNALTRGPLRPSSRSVALEKACSPCECKDRVTFQSGNCHCIGEISVAMVETAFREMVADPWPGRSPGTEIVEHAA